MVACRRPKQLPKISVPREIVHPITRFMLRLLIITMETWVKTNRRALAFGIVAPALVAGIAAWIALGMLQELGRWERSLAAVVLAAAVAVICTLAMQLRRPRVAFDDGQVLFYLRSGPPVAVPVEVVEAFFLGQGPLMLPANAGRDKATVNLVARLSQRATEWSERDVKPALGRWQEGYVTIRGTWCEPLDGELIRRLNRRLREVTEERVSKSVLH